MRFTGLSLVLGAACHQYLLVEAAVPSTWPTPFTSNFQQPTPPLLQPEFTASFNQHKWNANVSHITSGFIYSSPSQGKIRVDQAYEGTFGSSLFDFTNVTQDGVNNIQWNLSPSIASPPSFFVGPVQPAFVLFSSDFLRSQSAVYAGVVEVPYAGHVAAWNLMYSSVPVTVFVDSSGIVHGYDFWATNERTYVTTRFFNIAVAKIAADVFDFPKP